MTRFAVDIIVAVFTAVASTYAASRHARDAFGSLAHACHRCARRVWGWPSRIRRRRLARERARLREDVRRRAKHLGIALPEKAKLLRCGVATWFTPRGSVLYARPSSLIAMAQQERWSAGVDRLTFSDTAVLPLDAWSSDELRACLSAFRSDQPDPTYRWPVRPLSFWTGSAPRRR